MTLLRLGITNLRNIESASLELGEGVNLFVGANGSGKTSLLEAVYFLGSGRTFRSASADPLIRRGAEECIVFGQTAREGRLHRIGVQRSRSGQRRLHLDGAVAPRASLVARELPVLVLGPETVELVTGTPQERRRFLNWGVFHVEPQFAETWERLGRTLRQRNGLLKRPYVRPEDLAPWDERLAALGKAVDDARRHYFEHFLERFQEVCEALIGSAPYDCRYLRGWDQQSDLLEILRLQHESDSKRGFTQSGPQRADVRIRLEGQAAADVCSRGELKVLAWALVLAQGACFRERLDTALTYLVDDLAAELDATHRTRVARLLGTPGNQVLVTGIEQAQLETGWDAPTLFHVEHGSFHTNGESG